MNILPKKRWHVRTKDNIARVRRDEAEAAEKERERIQKQEYAESEARLNVLRSKANPVTNCDSTSKPDYGATGTITTPDGHVDLFSDFQSHIKTVNKEHEKEKKEEREKYEKQIGYLTYLGQDTNEALKLRSWYENPPKRTEVGEIEVVEKDLKTKYLHDPLTLIKKLLPEEKFNKIAKADSETDPLINETALKKLHKSKKLKKHKKEKKMKIKNKKDDKHVDNQKKIDEEESHKKELIDRLRRERLKREARERARQEELLCPKVEKPKTVDEVRGIPRIVQKYNSQFNPQLAKQNMA
ncbi:leukocyte receptor cluster member 1 homolog [Eupeodes corollae]|uniref:leukocyte receptor cluster member 1 homolog n=1 Tax=Eupeodes corollae TaxID=290404 RepID=UPI002492F26C|nr:leukocyte receptor cluster member 1 homolog [Eupeodes corollae]